MKNILKWVLITLLIFLSLNISFAKEWHYENWKYIPKTNYIKIWNKKISFEKIYNIFEKKLDKKVKWKNQLDKEIFKENIYNNLIDKLVFIIELDKYNKHKLTKRKKELYIQIKSFARFWSSIHRMKIKELKNPNKNQVEKKIIKKSSEITYTIDWRWASTNRATATQEERAEIFTKGVKKQTLTERILWDSNMYATKLLWSQVLTYDDISLSWIKDNMDFVKNKLDSWNYSSTTKFTPGSLKVLRADYNKAYHFFYEWWILEANDNNWLLSSNWYSWYERLVYYLTEWSDSKIQVLKDLWYRVWEGTIKIRGKTYKNIIYKDELNILKQKYDVPKY